MTREIFDVAVIGGGLHGLSAAMQLGRAGKRVLILERSWVGRHASGSTAAGVRTLNRDPLELDLALESMDMWHGIANLVGDDCGFHPHGQICVAERSSDLHKLGAGVEELQRRGYKHVDMIDAPALRKKVPAMSAHCVGASIAPNDGSADPHRTLAAFRRSAEAAGAVIRQGCGVRSIAPCGQDWRVEFDITVGGEAATPPRTGTVVVPNIVNAAGAWGARIASMVGDEIPLGTKASMMIVTERLARLVDPVVSAAGRTLSFKQSDQGTLIIGGGLQGIPDLEGEQSEVRLHVLAEGAEAAIALFPCVRDVRIVRIWAGLEAKTEDHLPIVGPSLCAPGVFHAFGYSGHGFELVPVVGAALADLVVCGTTSRAIGALNAARLQVDRGAPPSSARTGAKLTSTMAKGHA